MKKIKVPIKKIKGFLNQLNMIVSSERVRNSLKLGTSRLTNTYKYNHITMIPTLFTTIT